jgi:shikimate kinase
MGAGKSSVGRAMSEELGWKFEDLDDRIESRERRKVSEIFRVSGESAFRRAEHAALKELLSELRAGGPRIVALGGGAFAQKRNAETIEAANIRTVFLDADADELWRRCRQQAEEPGRQRPLLREIARFRELYEQRRAHYRKASIRQNTGGKSVTDIAIEVIQVLGLNRKSPDRKSGRRGK